MKTAIYIEDGDVQLVITPQNDWERNALKSFGDNMSVSVMRGEFYACSGGWHRHTRFSSDEERSLILRVTKESEPSPSGDPHEGNG